MAKSSHPALASAVASPSALAVSCVPGKGEEVLSTSAQCPLGISPVHVTSGVISVPGEPGWGGWCREHSFPVLLGEEKAIARYESCFSNGSRALRILPGLKLHNLGSAFSRWCPQHTCGSPLTWLAYTGFVCLAHFPLCVTLDASSWTLRSPVHHHGVERGNTTQPPTSLNPTCLLGSSLSTPPPQGCLLTPHCIPLIPHSRSAPACQRPMLSHLALVFWGAMCAPGVRGPGFSVSPQSPKHRVLSAAGIWSF